MSEAGLEERSGEARTPAASGQTPSVMAVNLDQRTLNVIVAGVTVQLRSTGELGMRDAEAVRLQSTVEGASGVGETGGEG